MTMTRNSNDNVDSGVDHFIVVDLMAMSMTMLMKNGNVNNNVDKQPQQTAMTMSWQCREQR